MKKKQINKPVDFINKILFWGMPITSLIVFIFNLITNANLQFFSFIGPFFFAWLFLKGIDRIGVSNNYKPFILLSFWAHLLGELYFYEGFAFLYYDKILHILTPILITLIVYDYVKKSNIRYPQVVVFFMVLGGICSYEIFEYFLDLILGYDMLGVTSPEGIILMDAVNDTFIDLILGGISSFVTLMFKRN